MIGYRDNEKRQKKTIKIQDSGHRLLEKRVNIINLMRLHALEEKAKKGRYFPIMGSNNTIYALQEVEFEANSV